MGFCKSCGECCNYVLVTKEEVKKIKRYIKFKKISVKSVSETQAKCKFLGDDNKCIIYPVRPEVCKLFGTYENLKCCNYDGELKPAVRPKKTKGLVFINSLLNE